MLTIVGVKKGKMKRILYGLESVSSCMQATPIQGGRGRNKLSSVHMFPASYTAEEDDTKQQG